MKAISAPSVMLLFSIAEILSQQVMPAPSLTPKMSTDFGVGAEIEQLKEYKEHNEERIAELENLQSNISLI